MGCASLLNGSELVLLELWEVRRRRSPEDAGYMGTEAEKERGGLHGWRDHMGATGLPPQPRASHPCSAPCSLFARKDSWYNAKIYLVFVFDSWHGATKPLRFPG